jgi:hypothetical protein
MSNKLPISLNDERNRAVNANAYAYMINDQIPEGEEREWAKAKKDEIADVAPDVLWARHEDGTFAIDQDYTSGYALFIQDELRISRTIMEQRQVVDSLARSLGTQFTPREILSGELGHDVQLAFLKGAMDMVSNLMDAELIERDINSVKE